MCGICGYLLFDRPIETKRAILQRMCDLLHHRGPDEGGIYAKDNVGLGHRRLSIIDLSSGQQPMSNDDESVWVVFNGEIYNFPELKADLAARGWRFRTTSDTEVIIRGYEQYGTAIVEKLNGMFAFALWDVKRQRLFAARDRLGKKPLYCYCGQDRLLFASELKSLLAEPEIPRQIDPEAIDKFFSYSYIPSPATIFAGIAKLRPGHCLLWENRKLTVSQYWDVRYAPQPDYRSDDEYVDQLDELLRAAVKRRLMSDVPLGAFLSGGIDSSTVVALMAQIMQQPVKTFTIGFEDAAFSETNDARIVAERYHTDHHELMVKPDALALLPDLVWHLDEPFGDSSAVPTYYVSKMARQGVTVILSGDGGDEIFAGYRLYMLRDRYERFAAIPRFIRRGIIGPLARVLPLQTPGRNFLLELPRLEERKRCEIVEFYPPLKSHLFSHDLVNSLVACPAAASSLQYWQNRPSSPQLSVMQYLDTKVYLPEDILMKVDKMSMANALETRAPLLDYTIAEFAATIPPEVHMRDGRGKYLLRKLAARLLPERILTKPKQGFAIPRETWFRNELRNFTQELLTAKRFRERGYFKQHAVELLLREHLRGQRDYSLWLWCLVIFELWHQIFVDGDSRRV